MRNRRYQSLTRRTVAAYRAKSHRAAAGKTAKERLHNPGHAMIAAGYSFESLGADDCSRVRIRRPSVNH